MRHAVKWFVLAHSWHGERSKAILSFRLRLHSGLRQSGSVFDAAVYGPTEVGPC
jgi:hypothetical protein